MSSNITLLVSAEAQKLAKAYSGCRRAKAYQLKTPEAVKWEAEARVRQTGGDPTCAKLVLSGRAPVWPVLGSDVQVAAGKRRRLRLQLGGVPLVGASWRQQFPVSALCP